MFLVLLGHALAAAAVTDATKRKFRSICGFVAKFESNKSLGYGSLSLVLGLTNNRFQALYNFKTRS